MHKGVYISSDFTVGIVFIGTKSGYCTLGIVFIGTKTVYRYVGIVFIGTKSGYCTLGIVFIDKVWLQVRMTSLNPWFIF